MAVLPKDVKKPYYQGLNLARDFRTAYQNRIVQAAELSYIAIAGKFDDRKARFDGFSVGGVSGDETIVTINVGPTHFMELRDTDLKLVKEVGAQGLDSIAASEAYQRLRQQGETDFSDPTAYFAQVFSVNGVPVTNDGVVHLVKRNDGVEIYPGAFHVIGGQYDVGFGLEGNLFQPQVFQRMAKGGILKEFSEEAGVHHDAKAELIALIKGMNIELAHVVYVPLDSETFLKYLKEAKEIEHDAVFSFSNPEQLGNFLRAEKPNFVPSGLSTLEEAFRRHQEGSLRLFDSLE